MAQCSPLTAVAWVGCRLRVISGLSLLLVLVPAARVSLRVLRLFSLHKNQHSKFQFDPTVAGLPALLLQCKYPPH